MNKIKSITIYIAGILLIATLLNGCGQSGPLYLPDNTAQTQQAKQ